MVRNIVNLALGLLLASSHALAGDACSSNEYTSLMKMTSNDRYMQQYCQSMPDRSKFDRNKCPQALKTMSYNKVKEYCGCYKKSCMPTNCGYKTKCSKSPCGNYCADLQTDPKSCGSCGKTCKYGEVCKGGKCKPSCPPEKPDSCPDPNKYGALTCTNKKTDKANCGACGTKCGYGYECKYGQCKPICPTDKPDQCPNPQKYGMLECTNKQKDPKNCGQCGQKCYDTQACKAGYCKCPEPTSLACGKKENLKCVDPTKDDNCGACGNVCTAPQMCKDKSCQCPVEAPTKCGKDCCSATEQCNDGKSCCTKNDKPCETATDCCPGSKCAVPIVDEVLQPRGMITVPVKTCQPDCQMKDQTCTEDGDCCPGKNLECKAVRRRVPIEIKVSKNAARSPLDAVEIIPEKTCQPKQTCSEPEQPCSDAMPCCDTTKNECVITQPKLRRAVDMVTEGTCKPITVTIIE